MTLLDRYIFKSVLFACTMAVALFSFIVLVPNVLRDMLPYVLTGRISFAVFARLAATLAPLAISYALPMGLLTGVLLVLGRLSSDSEIVAMRAAGLGLARIARPVFTLAALGAALALYLNFEAMPHARVEYERGFAAAVRSSPLSLIVPKTFIRDFNGLVIYVGEKQGEVLRDIWVWQLDDQRRVTRTAHAESGRIEQYDAATNTLTLMFNRVRLEARDEKDPDNFTVSKPVFTTNAWGPLRLPLAGFFARPVVHIKQEWLTYDELQAERARLAALPLPADPAKAREVATDRMKLELVFQDKINMALAVLALALVGVPLGIQVSRRETTANFGVAVALSIGYYLLTFAVKTLDRHPEYRPDLLLWLPNLLLLAWGGWLLLRLERR